MGGWQSSSRSLAPDLRSLRQKIRQIKSRTGEAEREAKLLASSTQQCEKERAKAEEHAAQHKERLGTKLFVLVAKNGLLHNEAMMKEVIAAWTRQLKREKVGAASAAGQKLPFIGEERHEAIGASPAAFVLELAGVHQFLQAGYIPLALGGDPAIAAEGMQPLNPPSTSITCELKATGYTQEKMRTHGGSDAIGFSISITWNR